MVGKGGISSGEILPIHEIRHVVSFMRVELAFFGFHCEHDFVLGSTVSAEFPSAATAQACDLGAILEPAYAETLEPFGDWPEVLMGRSRVDLYNLV